MGHREDLLAGARRCLEERGYARTTARDLVAASGTNLASIGYHFGSKEALLNEAIAASFQEWAERVRALAIAAVPDSGAAGDPVRLLVASWGAMLSSFAEYRGLSVAFIEALAQAERQPELRAQLAATYRRSRAQVAQMITEALGVADEQQASTLAAFQIALCDGLLVQWLLDPDATPSAPQLVDALTAMLGTAAPDSPSQDATTLA
ncbi:MAG TPA: TetR/AcrR family transcriptional regulator [Pseudonocardia sp.]|uniref:TetR/AcrR family transcriptional regulator n=1 Tax=Pseudonocardia sp. TaxID=60912 RepID=UPI002B5C478D|nr:TetR/AcrR family transcriptional regulator [Pseudonocardia sp.]HTF55204.1 TetR/AcrR family transcriptional regulator [Pseudonocardia sp.]